MSFCRRPCITSFSGFHAGALFFLSLLFRNSQPKILKQFLSRLKSTGLALHYPAQLIFTNAGILANSVSDRAATLDVLPDNLNDSGSHFTRLYTQALILRLLGHM
jgi:hypothetical protein